MGRVREGEQPSSQSSWYNGCHGSKVVVYAPRENVPMRTSRRYPHGIYSVLKVCPNASPTDKREAYEREVQDLQNLVKKAKAQARSAATARLLNIKRHAKYLFHEAETSADRVRRCRARKKPDAVRIENAKCSMRRSWKGGVKMSKYAKKHVPSKVVVDPPNGVTVRGKVKAVLPASCNSKVSGYVVVRRSKQSLRADRRLKKICVVPSDLFVKREK